MEGSVPVEEKGKEEFDVATAFHHLERSLVGGRFLIQEMDHMLRIANESTMMSFDSVHDFCKLFKESLPMRNTKDIGEMYANMIRHGLIVDNRFRAIGNCAPLKLALAEEIGAAPHVTSVERPSNEQVNSPKRAIRPVAPFVVPSSTRKPKKKRSAPRAELLGGGHVKDNCNVEGCSDFSLCNAHEGAPPGWPHETAKYLEALLFEWNGEVNAIPMTSPVGIFDKIEVYKVNDRIGLGVRAKGPPDQVVFEKGSYVGTYCGVLMNDILLWGCDKGHYLQMVASEVPHISVNAKGYGNYTRLFNHSRDSKNMDALVSDEKLEHPAGNFKFSPTEYWTCRDVYGGEQLCFDYGPEYFPHLDMVPLSQTPQRNPEQVPPPVLSMEGLKRSGSLVKQVLLSPAAKPPSAVKSSPEVEDEDEDDNFEENMEEDGDSDLEEGEYKPPKQPAAAREVTAIGADRMGHVKKTPEKRSAPPPSRVVSSDGPAAAAAPARANNEAVLWRNGAVRVLNWGTSNFFIARVGDRDPYIFRAGLICLFSAKGIVARVHCIAENRWHITVEGKDEVVPEFPSMGRAFKNIGLDSKGNESQTLKQKLQDEVKKLFGSGSDSKIPLKPKKAKKPGSVTNLVKTTAKKQAVPAAAAAAGPAPPTKQAPAKKVTNVEDMQVSRSVPIRKTAFPADMPAPTVNASNMKMPDLQLKPVVGSQFKVPAKRAREDLAAEREAVREDPVPVARADPAPAPPNVDDGDMVIEMEVEEMSGEAADIDMVRLAGRKRERRENSQAEVMKKKFQQEGESSGDGSDNIEFELPE